MCESLRKPAMASVGSRRPTGGAAPYAPTSLPFLVSAIETCIDADSRDRRARVGIHEEPKHLGKSGITSNGRSYKK